MSIERIPIANREQWLNLRKQDITASVAGALLGIHPYVSPYGLYLLKSGLLSEDVEETPVMRRGRLLEPVAVQMLREDKPGWTIKEYPVGMYLRDSGARLGATPDVMVCDENGRSGICQIKTVESSIFRRDWKGESGDVEPPLWIIIQGLVEAHLTKAEFACVAPMVVGFGMDMPVVPIPLHDGIIGRIKSEIALFWKRVADRDPPPQDYGRDGALLAKLYPVDDGTTLDLSGSNRFMELLDNREALKAALSTAESGCEEVETEIKAMLGEHAAAFAADGRTATFKTINRKEYISKATSYRKLRVSKAKVAKVA